MASAAEPLDVPRMEIRHTSEHQQGQIYMPEVNERLSRILQANPVTEIPGDILLIFRVLGLMSGLQKRLDSRVDVIETITPYAEGEARKIAELAAGDAAG